MATDAFDRVLLSDADLDTVRLPRFAELLEHVDRPFLFAVDDAHQLTAPAACDVIRLLVEHVPPGSSVAIATRDASRLGLDRARANGRVLDLGTRDLAMSVDEGTSLLRGCGLDVDADQAAGLVEKTEGWPAGLYLCTLALRDASAATIGAIGGRDRIVAEYLGNEMLAAATADQAEFLLHSRDPRSTLGAVVRGGPRPRGRRLVAPGARTRELPDRPPGWERDVPLPPHVSGSASCRARAARTRARFPTSTGAPASGSTPRAITMRRSCTRTSRAMRLDSLSSSGVTRRCTSGVGGLRLSSAGWPSCPSKRSHPNPRSRSLPRGSSFTSGAVDELEAWLAFAEGCHRRRASRRRTRRSSRRAAALRSSRARRAHRHAAQRGRCLSTGPRRQPVPRGRESSRGSRGTSARGLHRCSCLPRTRGGDGRALRTGTMGPRARGVGTAGR